jgi:hypothetical protein
MKRTMSRLTPVALAATLAACGGSDQPAPSPPDASTTFTNTVAGEVATPSNREPDSIASVQVGTSETASPIDISSIVIGI